MEGLFDQIFSEYGLLVLGLIVICITLWRKSEAQAKDLMDIHKANIERDINGKIQDENNQDLLVGVQEILQIIHDDIKRLRKAR